MGLYDDIEDQNETITGNNEQQTAEEVDESLQEQDSPQEPEYQSGPITPHLNETEKPVVFFVGPSASGKSMILVRLSQYLRKQGYTIETDKSFLNTEKYREACSDFNKKLSTTEALKGTTKFLLVSVKKNGTKICQFLEAPGEDYFDPLHPDKQIPHYIESLVATPNKKIFIFLLDLDSKVSLRNDLEKRQLYANRLTTDLYELVNKRRDRVILLYNKIDVPKFGDRHGCNNPSGAEHEARMLYEQVFNSLKRPALGGFINVPNYVFKTFCTGKYSEMTGEDGKQHLVYNPSADVYPAELWKEIMRRF